MPFDWASVVGAGIGAASNLLGGALSDRSAGNRNTENLGFAREQLQFQKDAAQSGIRWKVKDAQAAGIHPLYSLGATTFSPSPIGYQSHDTGNLGRGLADAGQNIGRAIQATRTAPERTDVMLRELQLERGALENEQIRLQNRRLIGQIGPPMAEPVSRAMPVVEKSLPTLHGPLKQHPGYVDAQEWEQRYGEPGEWLGGLQNLGVDFARSVKGRLKRNYRVYRRSARKTFNEGAGRQLRRYFERR